MYRRSWLLVGQPLDQQFLERLRNRHRVANQSFDPTHRESPHDRKFIIEQSGEGDELIVVAQGREEIAIRGVQALFESLVASTLPVELALKSRDQVIGQLIDLPGEPLLRAQIARGPPPLAPPTHGSARSPKPGETIQAQGRRLPGSPMARMPQDRAVRPASRRAAAIAKDAMASTHPRRSSSGKVESTACLERRSKPLVVPGDHVPEHREHLGLRPPKGRYRRFEETLDLLAGAASTAPTMAVMTGAAPLSSP